MEITANKTMMEAAYDTVKKAILSGYFDAGCQLVESEIVNKLEISRTPVREALRKLEQEGLVVCKPYKGVFVKALTKEDAAEIYSVQAALERLVVQLVVQSSNDAIIAELQTEIELGAEALAEKSVDKYIKHSLDFHYVLWRHCNNKVLVDMLNILRDRISLLRYKTLFEPDRLHYNLNVHKGILEAIINKNEEQAERLMVEHIEISKKVAMSRME